MLDFFLGVPPTLIAGLAARVSLVKYNRDFSDKKRKNARSGNIPKTVDILLGSAIIKESKGGHQIMTEISRTWTNIITGEEFTFAIRDEALTRLQARAVLADRFLDMAGNSIGEWVELPLEAFR